MIESLASLTDTSKQSEQQSQGLNHSGPEPNL